MKRRAIVMRFFGEHARLESLEDTAEDARIAPEMLFCSGFGKAYSSFRSLDLLDHPALRRLGVRTENSDMWC